MKKQKNNIRRAVHQDTALVIHINISHIICCFICCVVGSLGGGQLVVISGDGFSEATHVHICGVECMVTENITASELKCITPPSTSE